MFTEFITRYLRIVMPALVAGIHVFASKERK
jgi:hypothetical protein